MSDKKVTDVMLERIKYFINAVENGEHEPKGYEFAITLYTEPNTCVGRVLNISDSYVKPM